MSYKNYKKLSFFSMLTILIGSVVGIGIFFKNGSILRANDFNGWGVLTSWIIGGIFSATTAICFSEIGSMKNNTVRDGLPFWAEKASGPKLGYFTRFNLCLFYLSLLSVVLGVFVSESIINIFVIILDVAQPPVVVNFIFGIAIVLFALIVNYFSMNTFSLVQRITTILKFVPLILVIILGFALVGTNLLQSDTDFAGKNLLGGNGGPISVAGILAALPMVLFAFDAFLNVGNFTKYSKNGIKTVPIVIILGIGFTLAIYILITIAMMLHGVGFVSGAPFGTGSSTESLGLFGQIFSVQVAKYFGIFTMFFIAIAAYGVVNSFSASMATIYRQAVLSNTFVGTRKLRKKFGDLKTTWIYILCSITLWAIIVAVPTFMKNSDAVLDASSNFPTLFFFVIYATVIFQYARSRSKQDSQKLKNWIFYTCATIAILGTALVISYQVVYTMIVETILHPNERTSFGLFNTSATNHFTNLDFFYMFVTYIIIFFVFPLINAFLVKRGTKTQITNETNKEFVDAQKETLLS